MHDCSASHVWLQKGRAWNEGWHSDFLAFCGYNHYGLTISVDICRYPKLSLLDPAGMCWFLENTTSHWKHPRLIFSKAGIAPHRYLGLPMSILFLVIHPTGEMKHSQPQTEQEGWSCPDSWIHLYHLNTIHLKSIFWLWIWKFPEFLGYLLNHPYFDWEFPSETIHFGVPPWRAGNPHMLIHQTVSLVSAARGLIMAPHLRLIVKQGCCNGRLRCGLHRNVQVNRTLGMASNTFKTVDFSIQKLGKMNEHDVDLTDLSRRSKGGEQQTERFHPQDWRFKLAQGSRMVCQGPDV